MKFHVMTLFPEVITSYTGESILKRAQEKQSIEVICYNIRDYSLDKHKKVDDYPFGGGEGMVMSVQPIYDCYRAIVSNIPDGETYHTIYLSPRGKTFHQKKAQEMLQWDHLILLCGHYEGIDERAIDFLKAEEISIGDYILTGGELPAMVLIDTVSRMIDGVLSSKDSYEKESFYGSLLEHPQYTRPREFLGEEVPEVLLSGNHQKIEQWRREQSLKKTCEVRPDLLEKAELSQKEKDLIEQWREDDAASEKLEE